MRKLGIISVIILFFRFMYADIKVGLGISPVFYMDTVGINAKIYAEINKYIPFIHFYLPDDFGIKAFLGEQFVGYNILGLNIFYVGVGASYKYSLQSYIHLPVEAIASCDISTGVSSFGWNGNSLYNGIIGINVNIKSRYNINSEFSVGLGVGYDFKYSGVIIGGISTEISGEYNL